MTRQTVLAVASAGGHWTQLKLLSHAFSHCEVHYVTTHNNTSAIGSEPNLTLVMDADLSTKWRLLPLALKMGVTVLRHRPDVLISTGAAPGFFAVLMGKLLGAKTIWVDSMANYTELSVSGKYASKICDLCLTQWPDLANDHSIKYLGRLL